MLFTCNKNDAIFNGMNFVLSALDKKSLYNYIHVDNNNIVATDSHTLHIIKNEYGIECGDYKVLSCNKNNIVLETTDGLKFPNYEKVIPNFETGKKITTREYFHGNIEYFCSMLFNKTGILMASNNLRGLKYFEAERINIEYFDCSVALRFTCGNGLTIVAMPLVVDSNYFAE